MKGEVNKVVLAYSGGLDTSVIIPWLKENYGCEVIAFAADIGQGEELEGLEEKALKTGASKIYVEDLKKEFVEDFIFPMVKAGAMYERKYLLGTSIARPLIARRQIEIAEKEGADAVAHGCTGKGNDQVRFELTYKAFNPQIKVIAPWREWTLRSREDEIHYAQERNIPITATLEKIYSCDRNLWHLSHEGAELEDPWNEPRNIAFEITRSPEEAPDTPRYVEIDFAKGIPVAIDGECMGPVEIVQTLNHVGAEHAIGRIDLVENRLVGMKSRGIYETPGGTLLMVAHRELEHLVLDRDTMEMKDMLAPKYAELIYNGQWYTPVREALDVFVEYTQRYVSGTVRMKLYKGNIIIAGRRSPNSLYREDFATFGVDEIYNQKEAEGFINLFGLAMKVRALVEMNAGKDYVAPMYSKFKRD